MWKLCEVGLERGAQRGEVDFLAIRWVKDSRWKRGKTYSGIHRGC